MCKYDECTGDYAKAYAKSESVLVSIDAWCPTCKSVVSMKQEAHVHFGGEAWTPVFNCNCGSVIRLVVVPKTMFPARK